VQRRVVITGLGVIAPNGIGKELFWDACLSGSSGIRPITRFDASSLPSQIAGEVTNFEPAALGLTPNECQNLDRNTQFALGAGNLALQDAEFPGKLSTVERESMGVYIGSGINSLAEIEKFWLQTMGQGNSVLYNNSNDYHSPSSIFMTHASAAAIASHHQLHGPCMVISTACSSGADAIGQAFWTIQKGRADRMLAGGTDAPISPIAQASCSILGTLSTHNQQATQASCPYDSNRDGFVMAEGAGILLLEERKVALARNAHIYAELIAFASNNNGYHMTALPTNGAPLQQLFTQALEEAQLQPEQLGYINSHGSSTRLNDMTETTAYKSAFGEQAYHIPISATKSLIGHSQGAASAIETIVTSLVLEHQIIPPTTNLKHPDPLCDLDYVPNTARQAAVEVALTHSSGFGGVNSALVLAQRDWLYK
jgi:3-oxoacyl-(acyl-carrier-protein) synthase